MQHRLALILLLFSLAFAAITLFMLCLLHPRRMGPGANKSSNGVDAYSSLAGLPIRRSIMTISDAGGRWHARRLTSAFKNEAPAEVRKRHGGSVLPIREGRRSEWQPGTLQDPLTPLSSHNDHYVPSSSHDTDETQLRLFSGFSLDPRHSTAVDVERAVRAAKEAGLCDGFLLDELHPARLRSNLIRTDLGSDVKPAGFVDDTNAR